MTSPKAAPQVFVPTQQIAPNKPDMFKNTSFHRAQVSQLKKKKKTPAPTPGGFGEVDKGPTHDNNKGPMGRDSMRYLVSLLWFPCVLAHYLGLIPNAAFRYL